MGRAKATLRFGRTTMLERIVAELGRVFSEIVIAAAPEGVDAFRPGFAGITVIRDKIAYAGPAGALERGLRAASNDVAFACSCDLPMLKAGVARELCLMIGDHDAVIPEVAGRLQTLHAAYRKRCAESLAAMRQAGEPRLRRILDSIRARIVPEDELRRLDPDLRSFLNVNTPADYERALKLAGLS